MADVVIAGIYEQKKREFGTRGAGLARFDEDFVDAANYAIREINAELDLSSQISTISATSGTVSGMDVKFTHVLSEGISKYLMRMGRRPADGAKELYKSFEDAFNSGKFILWGSTYNEDMNEDDDAGTDENTIIGLGATE